MDGKGKREKVKKKVEEKRKRKKGKKKEEEGCLSQREGGGTGNCPFKGTKTLQCTTLYYKQNSKIFSSNFGE